MSKPTSNALARYLAAKDLSPAAFAVLVGADRQRVWRWTKGLRGPSVEMAVRIARVTGGAVPVETWTTTPPPRSRRAA